MLKPAGSGGVGPNKIVWSTIYLDLDGSCVSLLCSKQVPCTRKLQSHQVGDGQPSHACCVQCVYACGNVDCLVARHLALQMEKERAPMIG